MAYARKVDGAWIEVSGGFTAGAGDDAIQYPAAWLDGADADQHVALGTAEIVDEADVAPCLRQLGQVLVDVAGVPHRRWAIPPAADVRTFRRGEVAALRWDKQQTVKWNGRVAQADDTTLGRLMAAVMRAQIAGDPTFSIRWKFGDADFAELNLDTIKSYGTAIGTNLQACYDREAELVAEINAAPDVAAISAIDIASGWPA